MGLIPYPLPCPTIKHLYTEQTNQKIRFFVESKSSTCICPSCQTVSSRSHSRYQRVIQDLPINEKEVEIILFSRKWFCDSTLCTQKVFTERYSWLSANRRRTVRAEELLRKLAFSTSCLSAEKLARSLHIPVSHDTLLNLLYSTTLTPEVSPFCRSR